MAIAYFWTNAVNSTDATWPIWCASNQISQTGTTTITIPTISSNTAWTIWNQVPIQVPTVVRSDTGETWIIWNSISNQTGLSPIVQAQGLPPYAAQSAAAVPQSNNQFIRPTRILPERVVAANAEWERRQAEQRVYAEAKKAASDKAHGLLIEHLDSRQRRSLSKRGWFQARGGMTGRQYKIHGDRCAGNIIELEGRKEVAQLCVHADHSIPLGDQLLAQLLHIQHDEEYLLKRANRTVLH